MALHSPSGVSHAIGWYATRRASVVYVPANLVGTVTVVLEAEPGALQRRREAHDMLVL
jgi:hypothetical protein